MEGTLIMGNEMSLLRGDGYWFVDLTIAILSPSLKYFLYNKVLIKF